MLGLSVLFSAVAAVLTGVLPVGTAIRAGMRSGLSAASRTVTAGRATRRVRRGLVVAQIALSLMLVIGAGLLVRSFTALLDEDRGFRTNDINVTIVQTWGHIDAGERATFVGETTRRMAAIPGVRGVAVANSVPLGEAIGAEWAGYTVPGQPFANDVEPLTLYNIVSDDYFRTLGIALREGRAFTSTDGPDGRPVAVINESLARRHWPNQDPVGQQLDVTFGNQTVQREVVGVVGDMRRMALHESPIPTIYAPFAQQPTGANAFFVWTAGDGTGMHDRLKDVLWEFAASMPVQRETTMATVVGESVRERRFLLTIVGLSAALAFLLAAVGVFGVMSYITAERTKEFGVRLAFGARAVDVVWMVMREASGYALIGITMGLLGAAALSQGLTRMLYAVTTLDPLTFVGGAVLLLGSALVASWIPAARAGRADAVKSLRTE